MEQVEKTDQDFEGHRKVLSSLAMPRLQSSEEHVMKITPTHILMTVLSIVVGVALIYAGLFAGWGLVWVSGGTFFIAIGVGAGLLTLSWKLSGRVGAILRRPRVSILILGTILMLMALTVYLGIVGGGR